MSRDLNKVQVIGRLGADPESKYTNQGTAVTTFRVASTYRFKRADGTPVEETEWFRCVAWNKLAEICGNYITKGTKVYVEGRLKTRKYEQDGVDKYITEVILDEMIILSDKAAEPEADAPAPSRPATTKPSAKAKAAVAVAQDEEDLPF